MKGRPSHRKGAVLSEKTKKKISEIRKKQGSPWMKGRKFTKEHRRKLSESHKGKKSYRWKGGITEENQLIRSSLRCRRWRTKIFKRDDYTCQECGDKGVYLEVHHIKSFARHPKLRFKMKNGTTMCKGCHRKTDGYKSKRIK